jgi:YVTN family beta-propeller protein
LVAGTTLAAQTTGTIVTVNKSSSTVSLIDLATGAITATVPTGEGPHEAAVSPDGKWVLVSDYGPARAPGATLTLVDIEQGTLAKTISVHGHPRPHGIVWLPDGKTVLVTSEVDSSLLVVDVASGAVTAVIAVGQPGSQLLALSADGSTVYVTNVSSSTVTKIDVASRTAVKSVPIPQGVEGIALRPDGSELWVSSRTANRITVLSAADLSVQATIGSKDYPMRMRFTPDGKILLVTFARSGELKWFDADARKELEAVKMRVPKAALHGATSAEGYLYDTVPLGLTLTPDGLTALVALAGQDAVAVVAVGGRGIAKVYFAGREPDGVAYSPLVRSTEE